MKDWIRQRVRRAFGPKVTVLSERASLTAFDPIPLLIFLAPFALVGTLVFPWLGQFLGPLGIAALGFFGLVACFACRTTLVITPEGAFGESSTFGIVYRRVDLGCHPALDLGWVWDWSELSVSPTEPHIDQTVLHDRDRFVVFEYHEDDHDRYVPLVELLQREINRLHGPPHDAWLS